MISYKTNSDITKVTTGIIAHGVNCQRVMGAGVARAIREEWPEVYEAYMNNMTDTGAEKQLLGSAQILRVDAELWIANCYTQLEFGPPPTKWASPKAIAQSLHFVFDMASERKLTLHTVKIGSALGGLDWETEVRPIFERLNTEYGDVEVIIHDI